MSDRTDNQKPDFSNVNHLFVMPFLSKFMGTQARKTYVLLELGSTELVSHFWQLVVFAKVFPAWLRIECKTHNRYILFIELYEFLHQV